MSYEFILSVAEALSCSRADKLEAAFSGSARASGVASHLIIPQFLLIGAASLDRGAADEDAVVLTGKASSFAPTNALETDIFNG